MMTSHSDARTPPRHIGIHLPGDMHNRNPVRTVVCAMIHSLFAKLLAPFTSRRALAEAARGKIITNYWAKPIPLRQFDWCATFDNDEPNDNGWMLHGYGATEAEAIKELLTAWDDTL